MKVHPAVVNFANEKHAVELRDVPVPEIGPEDVLLDVQAVGVCGSDLHMWTCQHSWTVNYPCVLGHEFGGVVHELGERVSGWKVGDRVVSETGDRQRARHRAERQHELVIARA